MQFSIYVLSGLLALTSSAAALGINCRGSAGCAGAGSIGGHGTRLSMIKNYIDSVDNNRHYNDGDHIACIEDGLSTGICAFYQGPISGGSGQEAKQLIQDLINHGCTACGSVPTQPGNDVSKGQLTVNYVTHPNCNGAC